MDSVLVIGGGVHNELANVTVAQWRFLTSDVARTDIQFYINSPGGSVSAGLAIYDTMRYLRCDVSTYCVGMAASMGAVLLMGGTKEKRYLLPNSSVLLHQPLIRGLITGPATDLEIEAHEMIRVRDRLYNIIANETGRDLKTIEKDCDRNYWLDANQAIEYGVADKILEKIPAPTE